MTKNNSKDYGMIPVLTSPAGACLTAANWQEAGVVAAAYHLASLLLKPGYDLLASLTQLQSYSGWSQVTVLNASMPGVNHDGQYVLRSPHDGSIVRHSINEILALISRLQPQFVILPQGVLQQNTAAWLSLPASVFPFFPVTDLASLAGTRPYGVYFAHEPSTPLAALLEELVRYRHLPRYVSGDLSLAQMKQLIDAGVDFVESDRPAAEACRGNVYSKDGIISLCDVAQAQQFKPIDANCDCPTCQQQFTCAYLHHLFTQTPLLCQRFLIQHNVHFVQSALHSTAS